MAYIKTKSIDVMGPIREEPEGALEALMASIQRNSLLHPVTVIKHPEAEGRWLLVAGRRRFAAICRLGRKQVRALIRDAGEMQAEMITITENYHRLELSVPERNAAIVRYAELLRICPEPPPVPRQTTRPRQGPPGKKAALATVARSESPSYAPTRGPSERSRANEPAVVDAITREFGVSVRTANRALHQSDALTPEGYDILVKAGISDTRRLERIAAIKDSGQRALVIETIGEGVGYENAMSGVLGDDWTIDPEDLSDGEWLRTLPCSSLQVDKKRFQSDALFYRRIQRAKIAFALDLNWEKLRDQQEYQGLYFRRLLLLLDCPHPRQWIKCSGCTAGIANGKEHFNCRGCGYLMG